MQSSRLGRTRPVAGGSRIFSVLEPEGPLARLAAMRVLLVSHLFPPAHSAGTELYTAELGARLAARGCTVTVFTTDKDVGREDLSTRHYRGPLYHLP